MKTLALAVAVAGLGTAAAAKDFNFTVTSMMDEGDWIAPLVILDAAAAQGTLFDGSEMSEAFKLVATDGDPRPMNGTMPEAVAGLVYGTAGPPGVMFEGGETGTQDIFVPSTTLRFFAKDESCDDCIVSGVWDIAMGGGEFMLHSYSTGQADGSGKITLAREGVLKVTITEN